MRAKLFLLLALAATAFEAAAQTQVQDIFGRTVNQHGITLIDWDGYMANPLIQLYLLPPTNSAMPASAVLTANGARLYFNNSTAVSSNGPTLNCSFSDNTTPVPIGLSIFPAHTDPDGSYTLTIIFTDNHGVQQTNTVPINVIDEDTHHTNAFVVNCNFDRDTNSFFTNVLARQLVNQAANDWTYYFTGMGLDQVPIGAEQTYIWNDNFADGYYFQNTNAYTGYLLYAYGTTNSDLRSGGEGSYAGGDQTSNGVPFTIHRSGGFEAEINGNYNTLGWLFLTNDSDWLKTDNYGDQTNDFFSIAHHEIGHALIFNQAHPGFATALANGAFTSDAVVNYYGGPVPIDASDDHLTGVIDPESGQGAFGWEYYGSIPRYRWTMTKIDLLCAQEVGYTLRPTSAFLPFTFASNALPAAQVQTVYGNALVATGGLPIYDWNIEAGALPPGLNLDRFTGLISGTPTTNGTYTFTASVSDYNLNDDPLAQDFTLTVNGSAHLGIILTNAKALITIYGASGQQHILQVSTNLTSWSPLATNTLTSNQFQFLDTNSPGYTSRYYRSSYH